MSEAVSALNEARFSGLVEVAETGLSGMITLRGDLQSDALAEVVRAHLGTEVPAQRAVVQGGEYSVIWMSSDELLVLCPHSAAQALTDRLGDALSGQHALVVNVSDARARFRVTGPRTREVLAKLAPVDLGLQHPMQVRRTRMAQVAAAFWLEDLETAHVICFRSVAGYMLGVLSAAAAPGSEVDLF